MRCTTRTGPVPRTTATSVVPVTVPLAVERAARERAGRLEMAVEDALAEHVTVVPAYCFSPRETAAEPDTRRVALHTAVQPELAEVVEDLADGDEWAWVREAVLEKVQREADWTKRATATPDT